MPKHACPEERRTWPTNRPSRNNNARQNQVGKQRQDMGKMGSLARSRWRKRLGLLRVSAKEHALNRSRPLTFQHTCARALLTCTRVPLREESH